MGGEGPREFEEVTHGCCWVWGYWARLSLLDGIQELDLSQDWLVMEATAKGCGLMSLDGDIVFQNTLSMGTWEELLYVQKTNLWEVPIPGER